MSRVNSGSFGRLVVGAVLVVVGVGWLLNSIGIFDFSLRLLLPVALIVVGVGLFFGSRTGSHPGLIALGVVLTVLLAIAPGGPRDDGLGFRGRFGERVERPSSVLQLRDRYDLDAGQLLLDLTAVELPRGTTEVEVRVSVGQIVVRVPDDMTVRARAQAGIGRVDLAGDEHGGFGPEGEFVSPDWTRSGRRLALDMRVGVGQVELNLVTTRRPQTPDPVPRPPVGGRDGRA